MSDDQQEYELDFQELECCIEIDLYKKRYKLWEDNKSTSINTTIASHKLKYNKKMTDQNKCNKLVREIKEQDLQENSNDVL